MTGSGWAAGYTRHERAIELAFLCFNLMLFTWCLGRWQGWWPVERAFQPQRMVLLSGALLAQSLGAILRARTRAVSLLLLGAAVVMLAMSLAVSA